MTWLILASLALYFWQLGITKLTVTCAGRNAPFVLPEYTAVAVAKENEVKDYQI